MRQITRIFNGFEVRMKFRHEGNWWASLGLMPNSYPEWRNFQFAPNNHYRFFLHSVPLTIVFKLGNALFYQFYAEVSRFSIKKCLVRLLSTTSWHHARVYLTPPGIRRKYPERVKIAENLVGYARNMLLVSNRMERLRLMVSDVKY